MVVLRRVPGRTSARSLSLALVLALTVATALPLFASEPAPGLESEIKAAFLYNFAKFIEWPAQAFSAPSAPFTFCVYGDDSVGADLDTLIRGEALNGRRLAVLRLHALPAAGECHVLFLGAAEKAHASQALAVLGQASVLTVGEGKDFLDNGGMIRLFLIQNRMRFDINLDAAEKCALKISSKLLRLAHAVNPQRPPGGEG